MSHHYVRVDDPYFLTGALTACAYIEALDENMAPHARIGIEAFEDACSAVGLAISGAGYRAFRAGVRARMAVMRRDGGTRGMVFLQNDRDVLGTGYEGRDQICGKECGSCR